MATKSLTSRLVLEVVDRVTAPARGIAQAIAGIGRASDRAGAGSFNDRLNAAIENTNAGLDAARGRMVDAVAGAYALRAALGGPVTSAMAMEDAMADVAKTTGLAGEELDALRRDLVAMSKDIPMAATDLAAIAAAAGQAGIPMGELSGFTLDAARAAVAFDIPAGEMGQTLAELRTALGLDQAGVMQLADAINHLSNQTAASAPDLVNFTSRAAAFGKMAGYSAEEVAALGAAMISAGAAPEVAATSFNNMAKALTKGESATKGQRAAFAALGLEAEAVAAAMQKDAAATTDAVLSALAALPAERQMAVASQLFGDEARALGPLLTNLDLYRDAFGMVGDQAAYAGSAVAEFEARSKTTGAAMQRFRNRLTAVSLAIGAALLPALTDVLDRIAPVVDAVAAWAEANPNLTAALVGVTAALVGLRIAAAALSYAGLLGRSGVLSALSLGMATVGRAAVGLRAAAGGTIALQTALAAMQGATLTPFQKLAAGARGLLTAVPGVGMLAGAIKAIGAAVATISAPVWGAFALIAAGVAAAGVTIYKYWDRITATLSGVGQAVGEILAPALEAVRPVLDWFAPLGNVIAAGWEKATGAISAVSDWLGRLFQREALSDADKAAAKQSGYDFVMAIWDGMKQVAADLVAWMKGLAADLVRPITDGIATIQNAARRFGIGSGAGPEGFAEDFGVDGQRAKGGPISKGGRYLVGEEGPELITASRSGYVQPTGTGMGGGGAGGLTVNQNLSFTVQAGADAESTARRIMGMIEEESRRMFRGLQADAGLSVY